MPIFAKNYPKGPFWRFQVLFGQFWPKYRSKGTFLGRRAAENFQVLFGPFLGQNGSKRTSCGLLVHFDQNIGRKGPFWRRAAEKFQVPFWSILRENQVERDPKRHFWSIFGRKWVKKDLFWSRWSRSYLIADFCRKVATFPPPPTKPVVFLLKMQLSGGQITEPPILMNVSDSFLFQGSFKDYSGTEVVRI